MRKIREVLRLYSVPHALVRRQLDCPADGPHRRVLPSRPARREPRPLAAPGAPHHRGRAHAREAPPHGRLDARRFIGLGREDRTLITAVLARRHPQQDYRSCMGLQRLAKCYGDARLEAAAAWALAVG